MSARVILAYHAVSSRPGRGRFKQFVVSPQQFDEHMHALHSVGIAVRNASDALAEAGAVGLTFDDAYADLVDTVPGVLARVHGSATVFVPTAYVGRTASWLSRLHEQGRGITTWGDLADLAATGCFEIGGHGHGHLQLDAVRRVAAEEDVELCARLLEDRLGVSGAPFAYPFGYSNGAVEQLVRDSGFSSGFRVGEDRVNTGLNRFSVPRVTVRAATSPEDLLRLCSSGPPRTAAVARRLARPVWRSARRALELTGLLHPEVDGEA